MDGITTNLPLELSGFHFEDTLKEEIYIDKKMKKLYSEVIRNGKSKHEFEQIYIGNEAYQKWKFTENGTYRENSWIMTCSESEFEPSNKDIFYIVNLFRKYIKQEETKDGTIYTIKVDFNEKEKVRL